MHLIHQLLSSSSGDSVAIAYGILGKLSWWGWVAWHQKVLWHAIKPHVHHSGSGRLMRGTTLSACTPFFSPSACLFHKLNYIKKKHPSTLKSSLEEPWSIQCGPLTTDVSTQKIQPLWKARLNHSKYLENLPLDYGTFGKVWKLFLSPWKVQQINSWYSWKWWFVVRYTKKPGVVPHQVMWLV